MANVLSVSYDANLLRTRELLLQSAGYDVTSALGYQEAMRICGKPFDLAIIGHSIPKDQKLAVIECFRKNNPDAPVIALTSAAEHPLEEVDYYADPWEPRTLVRSVAWVLNPASGHPPTGLRRVK